MELTVAIFFMKDLKTYENTELSKSQENHNPVQRLLRQDWKKNRMISFGNFILLICTWSCMVVVVLVGGKMGAVLKDYMLMNNNTENSGAGMAHWLDRRTHD